MPHPSTTSSNTAGVHTTSPEPTDNEDDRSVQAPAKRRRAALACERCKSRKQRCVFNVGGPQDRCVTCDRAGLECVMAHKATAKFKGEVIIALEERIALLESRLIAVCPDDPLVQDHLRNKSPKDVSTSSNRRSESPHNYATGLALLSLNAASEPHYFGPTSGYVWTKLVSQGLGPTRSLPADLSTESAFRWRPQAAPSLQRATLPEDHVNKMLFDSYYMHVHARYPFLNIATLQKWLAERDKLVVDRMGQDLKDPDYRMRGCISFFVWMMYAVGARLLQGASVPDLYTPEAYYSRAMEHVDLIVTLHNLDNVQAYLILIMYSLRCAESLSVCHLTALSLSLAVEMGLHRRRQPKDERDFASEEMRKRVWWSIYSLDRLFALSLGRPLGISDRDIDQALPCNVDSSLLDTATFPWPQPAAWTFDQGNSSSTFTTDVTSAIHVIRLRRILGRIQTEIFAVGTETSTLLQSERELSRDLDQWRVCIPKVSAEEAIRIPCCAEEWFLSRGEAARLALLRPLTFDATYGDQYTRSCARAAAELCDIHRRLHRRYPVASMFSLTDLQDVFLTGLTLLHCVRRSPDALSFAEVNKAIRACSNSLFVYAQQFPAAEHFRDAFESIAEVCLEGLRLPEASLFDALPSLPVTYPTSTAGQMEAVNETFQSSADNHNTFVQLLSSLGMDVNGFSLAPSAFGQSQPSFASFNRTVGAGNERQIFVESDPLSATNAMLAPDGQMDDPGLSAFLESFLDT